MTSPDALRARLCGCIAPVVTPFDAEGRISLSGFSAVLDFLASQGVGGIVPGDLIGEYPALSLEERQQLIEAAVKLGRGRFVVAALVSDASIDTAMGLARFAERAGADAIKVALPYPFVPTDAMVLEYVRRVTGASTLPFIVESSDELQVSIPVIAALCADTRFVGMEEMGTSLGRLQTMHREFAGRIALLPAGETALLMLCLLGAPGCLAAENNVAPVFMGEFLEACKRRDIDRALALFDRRTQYRDLFRAGLHRQSFTPWTKAAMELLGVPVGKPRPPHEQLTAAELVLLRKALVEQFGLAPRASER
jgi:4-hydroxy-tetrahydrodipicolinate synthase